MANLSLQMSPGALVALPSMSDAELFWHLGGLGPSALMHVDIKLYNLAWRGLMTIYP